MRLKSISLTTCSIKKLVSQQVGKLSPQHTHLYYAPNYASLSKILKIAGFNALELMMVLAVVAVATVTVIKTMGSNSDKQHANQMVGNVGTMISNIRNAYSSSNKGYATLTTEAAINMKVIPQDLRIDGTKIKNQFQGGTVEVAAHNSGEAFTIIYTNVPQAVCTSVVNSLGGSSFLSIDINSKVVFDANGQKPLDATDVATACKAGGEKSKIIFAAS